MNKLNGRMLKYPSKKKQQLEILFIYGHHSSIERWRGLIQVFHDYGTVTVPDLPGFGGMESFYKINKLPTIDNYASYLASFIKMQYKRRKIVIVGVDFGFVIITRMLQNYPELRKNARLLISIKGFADHEDLALSKLRYVQQYYVSQFLSHQIPSMVFRRLVFDPRLLRLRYNKTSQIKQITSKGELERYKALIRSEINLWQINDFRTYMYSVNELLIFSNCDAQVNVPLWQIVSKEDTMLDNRRAEQHLKVIFNDYQRFRANKNLLPVILSEKKMANSWFPSGLKKALRELKDS